MPCYRPLRGYRAKFVNPTGKRSLVFDPAHSLNGMGMPVPCGQCIGCRLERSRQHAVRIMHEAQQHESNRFITLTFEKTGLSLVKKDFQDFMKRLRARRPPRSVHYFHCGEYGERNRRPHHHAILFGVSFEDEFPLPRAGANAPVLYGSAELNELWPHGFSSVGAVTFESAAYVARYCVKKRDDIVPKACTFFGERGYEHIDPETGEVVPIQPEYLTMSRRPAIGRGWLEKYGSDVYPSDEVVSRGRVMKPPKYYDKKLEERDPELLVQIKARRLGEALERIHESSSRRLRDREKVKIAQLSQQKRGL